MKFKILGIGDLSLYSHPNVGDARLIASSLVTLELHGHDCHYLNIIKKYSSNFLLRYSVSGLDTKSKVCCVDITRELLVKYLVNNNMNKIVESKPDFIVCFTPKVWLLSKMLSEKLGLPLIYRPHSIRGIYAKYIYRYTHDVRELMRAPFSIIRHALFSTLSDFTVPITRVEENALLRLRTDRDKICTIGPVYLRTRHPKEDRLRKFEIPNETYFLSFGSFKGWDAFQGIFNLKMLIKLARKLPHAKFLLIMTSSDLREFCTTYGIDKLENIVPIGPVDDDYLSHLYKNACGFLLFYPWAVGVSMKLVEALYYGKAIITTLHPASKLNGLVERKAVLVADDFPSILNATSRLLNDENYRLDFERKAKQYFNEHLSPNKHATLWAKGLSRL
jgi:glycosyltransferase involved in cell wall biosynthesis